MIKNIEIPTRFNCHTYYSKFYITGSYPPHMTDSELLEEVDNITDISDEQLDKFEAAVRKEYKKRFNRE